MAMTKTQLNQIFREAASMEFTDIPCQEEQIAFDFSNGFRKKMEKLIARQKKSYWQYVNTAAKRIAVVAILILSIAVTALSNEEVRASMLQWCEKIYAHYIEYFFQGDTTTEIKHEYQLMMIPEGFEITNEIQCDGVRKISYRNSKGDYIIFAQHTTKGYGYVFDNDETEVLEIKVRGLDIKIYQWKEITGAMWIEDGYYMSLQYIGCKDVEIVKQMVEMIK